MSDQTLAPEAPRPSNGAATREYLLDMIEQLARMAWAAAEPRTAILLEAILAVNAVDRDPR